MKRILREYGITPEDDIRSFARKFRGQPLPEHFAQFHNAGTVRLAKGLFSKGWILSYKERHGLDTSFFSHWSAFRIPPSRIKRFYSDETERHRIEANCGGLKKSNPNLYKAYALAYGLGLRSGELRRAKFRDLWQTEENKIIRIWQPKGCDDGEINGIGFQDRPCDPAWWDELMSFKTADDELIVLTSDAQKLISREFPKFLREKCGLTSKRPVHRLRKWAGHRTMRQNDNNPFIAQKVLGHSSIMMTTKIYVGLPTVSTGTLPHKTTNKEI